MIVVVAVVIASAFHRVATATPSKTKNATTYRTVRPLGNHALPVASLYCQRFK